MSTRNIPAAKASRTALVKTADQVKARATGVAGELNELKEEEQDVKIGAAAALQSIQDDRAPLDEERTQLISILQSAGVTTPPTPPVTPTDGGATEPAASAADPAPVTEPVAAPAAAATPVTMTNPAPAPAPAPTATAVAVAGPAGNNGNNHAPHLLNPRNWRWFQWVLAVLLGIIGLVVGLKTVGWAISDYQLNVWDWVIIIIQVLVAILWIGGLTLIGFYLGAGIAGVFGHLVNRPRRQNDEHANNQIETPAQPAVALAVVAENTPAQPAAPGA